MEGVCSVGESSTAKEAPGDGLGELSGDKGRGQLSAEECRHSSVNGDESRHQDKAGSGGVESPSGLRTVSPTYRATHPQTADKCSQECTMSRTSPLGMGEQTEPHPHPNGQQTHPQNSVHDTESPAGHSEVKGHSLSNGEDSPQVRTGVPVALDEAASTEEGTGSETGSVDGRGVFSCEERDSVRAHSKGGGTDISRGGGDTGGTGGVVTAGESTDGAQR